MALEKRGIRSTRAVLPKACPTSTKEIMFIKHCAYNPTAECLIKLPTRRGKLSLPGGAVYLGKFSGGKPVGKGRLVDIARKKEKGKFSSVAEIFNRFSKGGKYTVSHIIPFHLPCENAKMIKFEA